MARKKTEAPEPQDTPEVKSNPTADLAQAIVEAIKSTSPIAKKTQFNKPSKTPWNSDGTKLRLKRKVYHHGMVIGDPTEVSNRLSNEEITLFNKLQPGDYCNGFVKVKRRRDKGIDIDYPIKTNSQRLRLVNDFGIRSFKELLQRCVDEAAAPKKLITDNDE